MASFDLAIVLLLRNGGMLSGSSPFLRKDRTEGAVAISTDNHGLAALSKFSERVLCRAQSNEGCRRAALASFAVQDGVVSSKVEVLTHLNRSNCMPRHVRFLGGSRTAVDIRFGRILDVVLASLTSA